MAATAKSVASGAAVFIGGLCFGILAMAGVLLGLDLAQDTPSGYTPRAELALLGQSPRVQASMADNQAIVETRSSDLLTEQARPTPVRLVIPAINVDAPLSLSQALAPAMKPADQVGMLLSQVRERAVCECDDRVNQLIL